MDNRVHCSIPKDDLQEFIGVIEAGLEYTRECLSTHDINLGRTTTKNRFWAEHMEKDILRAEEALKLLQPFRDMY